MANFCKGCYHSDWHRPSSFCISCKAGNLYCPGDVDPMPPVRASIYAGAFDEFCNGCLYMDHDEECQGECVKINKTGE